MKEDDDNYLLSNNIGQNNRITVIHEPWYWKSIVKPLIGIIIFVGFLIVLAILSGQHALTYISQIVSSSISMFNRMKLWLIIFCAAVIPTFPLVWYIVKREHTLLFALALRNDGNHQLARYDVAESIDEDGAGLYIWGPKPSFFDLLKGKKRTKIKCNNIEGRTIHLPTDSSLNFIDENFDQVRVYFMTFLGSHVETFPQFYDNQYQTRFPMNAYINVQDLTPALSGDIGFYINRANQFYIQMLQEQEKAVNQGLLENSQRFQIVNKDPVRIIDEMISRAKSHIEGEENE